MQKVATTRPLVAEIFSDCGRIKTGSPQNLWKSSTLFYEWPLIFMLTAEIYQLVFQKGLNQLNFFWNVAYISDFSKILPVANHAILRKFLENPNFGRGRMQTFCMSGPWGPKNFTFQTNFVLLHIKMIMRTSWTKIWWGFFNITNKEVEFRISQEV